MATTETIPGQQKGLAPEIRTLSLRYPELTQADIARKVGCSAQNVSQVLDKFLDRGTSEELRDYQENRADVYDALQKRILESVTSEKLAKVEVRDAVVAAGILHDKAALLRGQATGINVVALLDVVQAIKQRDANPRTISMQSDSDSPISAE